jgi:cell wall-associated NlpC family hydrolase
MVGPGWAGDAREDPSAMLERTRDALAEVSAGTRRAFSQTAWSGAGADGAADFIAETTASIDELADRADRLGSVAGNAGSAVARAHARLRDIVERFEARAAALEPYADSPDVMQALTAEAERSLAEAVAVVEELQAELDGHTAALTSSTQSAPAPTTPAGMPSAPMPSMGSGLGGSAAPAAPSSSGGWGSGISDLLQSVRPDAAQSHPEAAEFGDGVAIRLPDGSTATAPNPIAAEAVRNALTQLGVPYAWGGTTPGVGLDCSGLTQWAYAEAGLNLPRLAQDQDVGAAVAAGDLRPGDLAVWDGHVAMIVGNGQMIEAGDPVRLSPIRTDNIGQGFQGFWRPTA